MKQWKLISQWWNHQTSKNIKLQTEDFQHAESKKICHHFVLVVIVRDSQAAIPSFRMGHMFRLVCTDHLWFGGGGGYKTWPSKQCSSVWTLLTSSVLRLCSTNSSILSGIMNHSECCRLVHHPAVDRSSLTATWASHLGCTTSDGIDDAFSIKSSHICQTRVA